MCWVEAGLYYVHVGMTLPCYSTLLFYDDWAKATLHIHTIVHIFHVH